MIIGMWCEDSKRGIAKNGVIPWKIKNDLKLFKAITINNTIVMGYNTYLSIGKPLKNRINIVVSDKEIEDENIIVTKSIAPFLKMHQYSNQEIYLIGGRNLINNYLEFCQQLLISKLNKSYKCDLFMNNDFDNFRFDDVKKFEDFDLYIYYQKNLPKKILDKFKNLKRIPKDIS